MTSKVDRSEAARKAAATRRRNAALRNAAGQTLQSAMVSPVMRGCIRLWIGNESMVWRLDDPDKAAGLLGRGGVPAAVARGEFVVVERGGWDHQPDPFALAICAPGEGAWTVHIESVPPPPQGGVWPTGTDPPEEGATVSAPANSKALSTAAVLLVDAVVHWAKSPLDLAITFGSSPHGVYVPAPSEDG
jgi:hypothetical protein